MYAYVSTISLNPARSLGPAICSGAGPQWNVIWAFICGPIIGCLLAVFFDRFIVSQRGVKYKEKHQPIGQGGYFDDFEDSQQVVKVISPGPQVSQA
jgi:RsiW-degrading membrane proteinase PrsW (M82 family)